MSNYVSVSKVYLGSIILTEKKWIENEVTTRILSGNKYLQTHKNTVIEQWSNKDTVYTMLVYYSRHYYP